MSGEITNVSIYRITTKKAKMTNKPKTLAKFKLTDRDNWNLDAWLVKTIERAVKAHRKSELHGYPPDLQSVKDWRKKLREFEKTCKSWRKKNAFEERPDILAELEKVFYDLWD